MSLHPTTPTTTELFLSPTAATEELLLPVATPVMGVVLKGEVLNFSDEVPTEGIEEPPKSPFQLNLMKEARDLKCAKRGSQEILCRRHIDGVLQISSMIQAVTTITSFGSMGDPQLANSEIAYLGLQVLSEFVQLCYNITKLCIHIS